MASNQAQTCEIKVDGRWRAVAIDDAFRDHRDEPKRCPACHGAVNIPGSYNHTRRKLTLAHRRIHPGCPLRSSSFSGTPSLHPDALV